MAKCIESNEDPVFIKKAIAGNIGDMSAGIALLRVAFESIEKGHPGVMCPVEVCCKMAQTLAYTVAQFAALETMLASKKKGSPHAN